MLLRTSVATVSRVVKRIARWLRSQKGLKAPVWVAVSVLLFGLGANQVFRLSDVVASGWPQFVQTAILALAALGLANLVMHYLTNRD